MVKKMLLGAATLGVLAVPAAASANPIYNNSTGMPHSRSYSNVYVGGGYGAYGNSYGSPYGGYSGYGNPYGGYGGYGNPYGYNNGYYGNGYNGYGYNRRRNNGVTGALIGGVIGAVIGGAIANSGHH